MIRHADSFSASAPSRPPPYPCEVTFQYAGGTGGEQPAEVSGLSAERWSVGGRCEYPVRVRALPDAPVNGVRLDRLTFQEAAQDMLLESVGDLSVHRVTVNGRPVGGAA
ncbi:hypothetical protein GCM10010330_24960 [Streptomyces tendae]|uniref:hypothetical protein n=1 Tax=Streptomyces tendae TaxID=1932 RepID=UPI0016723E44|nr:hypothetical protein [Streptomyces tendae]GHA71172.1 hypothetical protein GCM10010330_24960 [Streptomyces tendae]